MSSSVINLVLKILSALYNTLKSSENFEREEPGDVSIVEQIVSKLISVCTKSEVCSDEIKWERALTLSQTVMRVFTKSISGLGKCCYVIL